MNEPLTPEALDKLESTAIELLEALPGSEGATAVLNLCRAYRTQESAIELVRNAYKLQESELRIAMLAWDLAYEEERFTTWEREAWLAEARAQEGK